MQSYYEIEFMGFKNIRKIRFHCDLDTNSIWTEEIYSDPFDLKCELNYEGNYKKESKLFDWFKKLGRKQPVRMKDADYKRFADGTVNVFTAVAIDGMEDVDALDKDGWSGLMICAVKGHVEMAKILLDAGADPNLEEPNGLNSLTLAAMRGKLECVELLLPVSEMKPLKPGAAAVKIYNTDPDPADTPADEPGALTLAKQKGNVDVQRAIEVFLEKKVLDEAASAGKPSTKRRL